MSENPEEDYQAALGRTRKARRRRASRGNKIPSRRRASRAQGLHGRVLAALKRVRRAQRRDRSTGPTKQSLFASLRSLLPSLPRGISPGDFFGPQDYEGEITDVAENPNPFPSLPRSLGGTFEYDPNLESASEDEDTPVAPSQPLPTSAAAGTPHGFTWGAITAAAAPPATAAAPPPPPPPHITTTAQDSDADGGPHADDSDDETPPPPPAAAAAAPVRVHAPAGHRSSDVGGLVDGFRSGDEFRPYPRGGRRKKKTRRKVHRRAKKTKRRRHRRPKTTRKRRKRRRHRTTTRRRRA